MEEKFTMNVIREGECVKRNRRQYANDTFYLLRGKYILEGKELWQETKKLLELV